MLFPQPIMLLDAEPVLTPLPSTVKSTQRLQSLITQGMVWILATLLWVVSELLLPSVTRILVPLFRDSTRALARTKCFFFFNDPPTTDFSSFPLRNPLPI